MYSHVVPMLLGSCEHRRRAEGEAVAGLIERQRMPVDHVVGVRLRQPFGEHVEALAAVPRAVDAALGVGAEGVPQDGGVGDVGIGRVDDQRADLTLLFPDVLPGLAGVQRLVDAVTRADVAADVGLAGAGVDHVGVGRGDGNGADRGNGLVVEDRLPVLVGAVVPRPRGEPGRAFGEQDCARVVEDVPAVGGEQARVERGRSLEEIEGAPPAAEVGGVVGGARVDFEARPGFSLEKVTDTFFALLQAALAGSVARDRLEEYADEWATRGVTAWDVWRRLPPKQRKQVLNLARKHGPKVASRALQARAKLKARRIK